ncbi:cob(I)yrinic acid a,c-diamide adenosyltransferase [Bacillus timonensis]|nr:cob(I)yrinic acid a,c-diamide adenosyltransferase [Bacillus timonensis]
MKIYTKTGDKGTTSLIYGQRVSKTDLRVEAYGTCDEANSFIGLAVSHLKNIDIKEKAEIIHSLQRVQTVLFHVGAELATPTGKEVKWKLTEDEIKELEKTIDTWDAVLPPLTNFVLPGGSEAGATLHIARTTVRRAERRAIAIGEEVNPLVCSYLNRLSDYLFVAGRYVNHLLNTTEPTLHE